MASTNDKDDCGCAGGNDNDDSYSPLDVFGGSALGDDKDILSGAADAACDGSSNLWSDNFLDNPDAKPTNKKKSLFDSAIAPLLKQFKPTGPSTSSGQEKILSPYNGILPTEDKDITQFEFSNQGIDADFGEMKAILQRGGYENSHDIIEAMFGEDLKGLLPGLLSKQPTKEELVYSNTLNANIAKILQALDVKKGSTGKVCFHCSFCKQVVFSTSKLDRLYSKIMNTQNEHYLKGNCNNEDGKQFATNLGETKVSRGGHRGNASMNKQVEAIVNLAKAKGYTDEKGFLEHSSTKISCVE